MDLASREGSLRRARGYLPVLLVGAVCLLQCERLVAFTLKYAVNILFWDQWDFYTPFFERASLWRMFEWQHGPPRLGIGSVFAWFLAGLTHWNSRSDALAFVGIVTVATLLAVRLKRRLFGPLALTDVVIPLLLLSRLQYEMIVGATDLSHGAFPVLLTLLICLGWLQPNRLIRYGLVLTVNFLMIFTGFGLFMGLITPALLALDCYRAMRAGRRAALAGGVLALGVALLSSAAFFIGYVFVTGAVTFTPFRFPYGSGLAYPWYAGLMFANAFGLKFYHRVVASVVGIAVLIGVAGTLIHHARLMLRSEGEADNRSRIIAILLGYSLLFVLATAVGRVQVGPYSADSSRYYPYVAIGILGLYFHLLTVRRTGLRKWGLRLSLLGAAVAGLHLTALDEGTIARLSNGKRRWRSCYLRTEDIKGCDKAAGFMIYPRPEATRLKEKLDYLKREKLNLYAPDP